MFGWMYIVEHSDRKILLPYRPRYIVIAGEGLLKLGLCSTLWHCSRKGSLLWSCILVQKRPIYSLCTQPRVPRTSSSHWELIYGPIIYSILQKKKHLPLLDAIVIKMNALFLLISKKLFFYYYFSLPVNCSLLFVKYS